MAGLSLVEEMVRRARKGCSDGPRGSEDYEPGLDFSRTYDLHPHSLHLDLQLGECDSNWM
jgi:hypothetical protein